MFPKRLMALSAAAVTALAIAACGGSSTNTTTTHHRTSTTAKTSVSSGSSASPVKLASISVSHNGVTTHKMGLVNSSNHPVYLLTGDSKSHPLCTSSSCLSAWPPVTTTSSSPKLGTGVHGTLTVWTHNGIHQLVLNGHPLYLFAGDGNSGIANGNDLKSFGGTWLVLNSSGAAIQLAKSSSGSSGSGTSTGSGSGYGSGY